MFARKLKMSLGVLGMSFILIFGNAQLSYAAEAEAEVQEIEVVNPEENTGQIQQVMLESETEIPEIKVLETEVIETEEPEIKVLETEVIETEEPEIKVPETETSETEAAEIEIPETEEPAEEVKQGWIEDQYFVDGEYVTGIYEIEGVKYGFDADGKLINGPTRINGNYYFFDFVDGAMKVSEFVDWNNQTLYYGADGILLKGPARINGKYYFFNTSNGSMMKNKLVNWNGQTLYYDAEGLLVKGPTRVNGNYYFFDVYNGSMQKNKFIKWNGQTLYYDANGILAKGPKSIGGKNYFFHLSNGSMLTGSVSYQNRVYYYGSDGVGYTGTKTIDGNNVKFSSASYIVSSWMKASGTYKYVGEDGMVQFSSDVLYSAWQKIKNSSSSTRYYVVVDTNTCWVMIFKGSSGNWVPIKLWRCSPGKSSTPTITGYYTIKAKGYVFGKSYSCYYYTQFSGDYLFHSILYDHNTFNVQDGRLGMHLSHGCVRLAIENAKWIQDNLPYGTKVYIY